MQTKASKQDLVIIKCDLSGKKTFINWNVKNHYANKLGLTEAISKYMLIKDKDKKILFEGKFRITTKGYNEKNEPNGYQIALPKKYADEISEYKETSIKGEIIFEILPLTDQYYLNYYLKLKEINELHVKYKFGKHYRIPGVFSESFIRYYYNLIKSNNKSYDAIDFEENVIEIKASSSSKGTVTINPKSDFDLLYWLYINFDNDLLTVYIANYDKFSTFLVQNIEKSRVTITLKDFICEEDKIDTYQISNSQIIKIDLND